MAVASPSGGRSPPWSGRGRKAITVITSLQLLGRASVARFRRSGSGALVVRVGRAQLPRCAVGQRPRPVSKRLSRAAMPVSELAGLSSGPATAQRRLPSRLPAPGTAVTSSDTGARSMTRPSRLRFSGPRSRLRMLQPPVTARSWIGAVKVVPPAGSPVPVMVPESCRAPLTTEVVRLLSDPVNAVPFGSVPATGSVVAAGCGLRSRDRRCGRCGRCGAGRGGSRDQS